MAPEKERWGYRVVGEGREKEQKGRRGNDDSWGEMTARRAR